MIDDFPDDELYDNDVCDFCGVEITHEMDWEFIDDYLHCGECKDEGGDGT